MKYLEIIYNTLNKELKKTKEISIGVKALALHTVDPGSIPSITFGSQGTARSDR